MRIYTLSLFLVICNSIFSQDLATYKAVTGTELDYESIMVSLNGGCSLACAIGWNLNATSSLTDQGENNYIPSNMNDGNKNTAWVEGKNDYGIGEKISIKFSNDVKVNGVPFRSIELINGYSKTGELWKSNSRVKLFRLYLNKKVKFDIELADSIFPQSVIWDEEFLISSGDQIELEIIQVYKGDKWKDTAISDIVLHGAH